MPEEKETAPFDTQCLGKSYEFHSNHNPGLSITTFGSYRHNENRWNCHPSWQGSPGHLRLRTVYPGDCLPKHPVKKCAGSGGKNCLQQSCSESFHEIHKKTRQCTLCSKSTTHYTGLSLSMDKKKIQLKNPKSAMSWM